MEGFSAQQFEYQQVHEAFTLDEIQLLLGGRPDIDLEDIRRDCKFTGGYVEESAQIEWLWIILEELDAEKTFTVSRVCDGLRQHARGWLGPTFDGNAEDQDSAELVDQALPRAHTCFNQLVVPPYSSAQIMKQKLLYALENAAEGFYIT